MKNFGGECGVDVADNWTFANEKLIRAFRNCHCIAETAQLELRQVRAALMRHASGAYGRCASCDAKIPAARLEAVPFAIHCLACAERLRAS